MTTLCSKYATLRHRRGIPVSLKHMGPAGTEKSMSIAPCTTHDMTASVTESMCVQEIAAPGTPPPQARMSRFGAAQAGKQGTGQSSAAQHGDQPPTGPNDNMQEANPYRSLGQPELFYKHTCFFDRQLNIGRFRTVSIHCREDEVHSVESI